MVLHTATAHAHAAQRAATSGPPALAAVLTFCIRVHIANVCPCAMLQEFNGPNGASAHVRRGVFGTQHRPTQSYSPSQHTASSQPHTDYGYNGSEPTSPGYVPPASESLWQEAAPVPQLQPARTSPATKPAGTQLAQQKQGWLLPWQTGDRELGECI